jgi:CBS domain-containing protein
MSTLRVRDLMREGVFALLPDDDLLLAHRLMDGWRVRHAPVVEEDGLVVGILSQRDLLRHTLLGRQGVSREQLEEDLRGRRAKEVMSVHVETVEPDTPLFEAAARMYRAKLGCLVVTQGNGTLAGILTEADYVRHILGKEPDMQNWGRGFALGALLGLVGGALLGLLYAPEKGAKTRKELARRGERLSKRAGEIVVSASEWVDKGRGRRAG